MTLVGGIVLLAAALIVLAMAWHLLRRGVAEEEAEESLRQLWRSVRTQARRREDLDEVHFNALAARQADGDD